MSNANTDDKLRAKVARVLSDRAANDCGVDKDDNWKEYGSVHIDDARAVLAAVRAHDAAAAPAAPQPQPEAVDDAPYWLKPGERFCLGCNKLGHFTNDCHSTFSANDAASRELGRLCWAANRATHVAGTTELEAAARAILQDRACQVYVAEYLRDNLRATLPPTKPEGAV